MQSFFFKGNSENFSPGIKRTRQKLTIRLDGEWTKEGLGA
jgi:hypothetical protein